jgi:hypothetical protein
MIHRLQFLVPLVVDGIRLNNEKLLIDKLQRSYPQKFGRPLLNLTGPVVITIRSQLIQIVKIVDTFSQFIFDLIQMN